MNPIDDVTTRDQASPIVGLHHVTATVDQAQPDLDFYVGFLGTRLVKKTVNFDNPSVYHFYYGNRLGTPGTLMTTFPYGGKGVPRGHHGSGQITQTRFAVPLGAVDYWAKRAEAVTLPTELKTSPFGEAYVSIDDPSGLEIHLVESDDSRSGWDDGGIPVDYAITGLHSVSFPTTDARASSDFLSGVLGWEVADSVDAMTRMAVNGGGAGRWIDIAGDSRLPPGVNGIGTVHHVAMAAPDDESQAGLRQRLLHAGVHVTDVKDRQYFRSIYFREPNGVLYEVATTPPGFAIDETTDELGRALKLPPWEEPNRPRIEAGLDPVVPPGGYPGE